MSDETTDAVAEAREMIAAFEVISNGRTRFEGQLVARIEALEAKLAAVRAAVAPYEGREPWTTTSADCDHESCERLGAVRAVLDAEPSAEAGER